ncbi:MAG: bifunctional phosphopantothenoylcysteine decarboxylase/phosphopantothenate--cysteine ligase CoaBC [Candidatus Limnocylindrales bacterium]
MSGEGMGVAGHGRLTGRTIGLGISGSIAAYKAIELLRLLQAEGADVRVLLTPSAIRFVAPLTLEALSRHPVDLDVLELQPDGRIGHIQSAGEADAIVVAPATAHWLGAMANGLAADSITAACLATSAPVVVAPAMDGGMYAHPATQANVARLRSFGYRVVEPEMGPLASGQVGVGRLAALPAIVDAVVEAVRSVGRGAAGRDLAERHVVVTAGGTAEPIDPVRFVGNRSTGKMGVAIAEAALARGARVTLIVGHVAVPLPRDAVVVRAETTAAMGDALLAALGGGPRAGFDVLVMAAAVADFRPTHPVGTKLTRDVALTLELEPTPDLLAEVGRRVRGGAGEGGPGGVAAGPRPVLVGFAAETGSLDRAAEKLRRKGLDLLVANDVAEPGSGFGTDTDRVTLYAVDAAPEPWPLLTKREVADRLLDRVAALLDSPERHASVPTRPPQEVSS